jgi:molybdopterin-containing oxidoreductase family iron-sulfur binding subunit
MRTGTDSKTKAHYGMVIDLDRCVGCGACMVACAVENNVPPTPPGADEEKGLHSLRVYRADDGNGPGEGRAVFFPVLCQHCDSHTPCVSVCPQNAVDLDPETGIVSQIASRCLGCRYCMAACPYHARSFNWWDPAWPEGMEKTLNPDVSPRMRGVAEKCNFCHGRLHAAQAQAAAEGRRTIRPEDYQPACVEACPTRAMVFGDLNDSHSEVARLSGSVDAFRLLERLGTEPKVYYLSERPWVRALGQTVFAQPEEPVHG